MPGTVAELGGGVDTGSYSTLHSSGHPNYPFVNILKTDTELIVDSKREARART